MGNCGTREESAVAAAHVQGFLLAINSLSGFFFLSISSFSFLHFFSCIVFFEFIVPDFILLADLDEFLSKCHLE